MHARRSFGLRAFAAKLRGFVRGQSDGEEFDSEIREHLRLLADRFVARGMSREDAAMAARRQFGNTTLLLEDRRALQTRPWIEVLWRDLRYALRTLRRSPGFAAAAVLALALGIASNTAIFSVVHATFLAPLPYRDSHQLVMVWSSNRGGRSATSAADFFEWRRRSSAFSDLHVTIARTDLGFRSDGVFTFYLPVEDDRLKAADAIDMFYRQLAERVSAVPSVTSVSYSSGMPAGGAFNAVPFTIAGRAVGDRSQRPSARFNQVSPAYFEALGIRIARGRAFTEADRTGMVAVAIVNETFVKRYFPDVDPLTQRVVVDQFNPGVTNLGVGIERQIVGVSGDVRNLGPASESLPEIHVPFAQSTWARNWIAVRTAGDPLAVHQPIAAVVRSIDPDLPMVEVRTMNQLVATSTSGARFTTILFGAFAFVALLLAALGIYGVMSFAVAQRTHEIGLRMALGAGRARVVQQVLHEGMRTAILGTLIGSVGAFFVARSMRGMVPGVGPGDPTAFIVVAATLIGVAFVACLLPASRAASVDPMTALRQE